MSDYDPEQEEIDTRAGAEDSGYKNVTVRDAWVIDSGEYGFEHVDRRCLWKLTKLSKRVMWLDKWGSHCQDEDIFATELDARNALEKRLYLRSENLRKHREAMTKALVACAFPMPGEEVTK